MPYKDPEKQREYMIQWRKKNPNYDRERWENGETNPERTRVTSREYYRERHTNCKHRYGVFHHDFETHRQLAMSSGIDTALEWVMCHKMGLMPDGIYVNPADAFKRKGPLKNNNTP